MRFHFGFCLVQTFGFGQNFGSKCNRKPKYKDSTFQQNIFIRNIFKNISENIFLKSLKYFFLVTNSVNIFYLKINLKQTHMQFLYLNYLLLYI